MTERADEVEIRARMRELHQAFRDHDLSTLDRILAEEFVFSDPNGPVKSKQQWLSDMANGNLVFDVVDAGPVEFKHLGDQALVDGEARLRVRYTESDYTGLFRYLGVYRREGGQWRLVLTSAKRVTNILS